MLYIIFILTFFQTIICATQSGKDSEVEKYKIIMQDDLPENTLQKPKTLMELTEEEQKELNNGICKVIYNESNSITSTAVSKRNENALIKIEKNMYLYILSESLRDYATELKQKVEDNKVEVTADEMDAIESALRIHCDVEDLKELYNILIGLPDRYEGLNDDNNGTNWENFVIVQLDRIYDYVNTHFTMFKKELVRLKNTKTFYERKNFYRKREGKSILMTIFYEWLENMVCKPKKIDEYKIRKRLNQHLKWVVTLPIE